MTILSSVPFWIIAILMLGLLILVHESGHYITGRLLKFKINEFSVGMGPKIVSKEKNGIMYSLRAIPMGGFVAFHGEDGENEDDPQAMNNMPWYKRAIVMFSGAGFNILFAYLVTAILVCAVGFYAPKLESISEESPLNGVAQKGDIIYAVNGNKLVSANQLSEEIEKVKDGNITFSVYRDGEKVSYDTQKYFDEENNKYIVGITYDYAELSQNPIQALGYSFRYNIWMTKVMYKTLWELITGKVGLENVTGPVSTIGSIGSMVQDVTDVAPANERLKEAIILIMELLVIISMNLAIMNLLPFPALDGFRLLFALIEGITKKHIPRKIEGIINGAGLAVLVGLMVLLEVSKLF